MDDPNVMDGKEVGRGIQTGFNMLTDASFNAITNSEGISDLKKLLRLLLTGVYAINTKPDDAPVKASDQEIIPAGDKEPVKVPAVAGGNNGGG